MASKKCFEQDVQFLKGQGLSEDKVSAISMYFQQRINSRTNTMIIAFLALFIVLGSVGYNVTTYYIAKQAAQDNKKLCIKNPFIIEDEDR